MTLYHRWQSKMVEDALKASRVVLLVGARQCGKSTLAQEFATTGIDGKFFGFDEQGVGLDQGVLNSPDMPYRTLDAKNMRLSAERDPDDFVKHTGKTLIIDEVQRVPELMLSIKQVVDKDNRNGQYLLTGSADISSVASLQDSMAGRMRRVRLRPLAQGEIRGVAPIFLPRIFSKDRKLIVQKYDREAILQIAFHGGFPAVCTLSLADSHYWLKQDYMQPLIDRDLQDIARIHKHKAMDVLVKVLAAWSSKEMDISKIASHLSNNHVALDRKTVDTYIHALKALFVVESVPAFAETDYEWVKKKDKIFMADTGLMSALLDWNYDNVRFDSDRAGKLMETFVFTEITKHIAAHGDAYKLSHYRDSQGHEVDFIIQDTRENLVGIEVKGWAS